MSFKFEHPENRSQRYYAKHREELKQWQKDSEKNMTKEQRENKRKYERDYYQKHRVIRDASKLIARTNLRLKIISLLGNKCIRCGESDCRCLQIDHVNGGGNIEREKLSIWKYYKKIIFSIESSKNEYQLLCANCNWKKRYEKRKSSLTKIVDNKGKI